MAMSSQFSLSVELTKIIPFGPLARLAGKGLVELLREVQGSGSDLVTEEDLTLIFGRNRIDAHFERTFRTAVRHSVIHQVHDIAELVLEAGAGPTVRRSLREPVFFSTIVQLSLLTWSHEITSLARSLAQALERRAREQDTYKVPPRYDALKGTLRACREQTSGFMWELVLAAVANQIADILEVDNWYEARSMPMAILQALLDGLTAVQHLPENAFLRISTYTGIPTIVVWAHHVLGLPVVVQSRKGVVRFGEGREAVYIDAGQTVDGRAIVASASLLNETKDLLFSVGESSEDVHLDPATRHAITGYGTRKIELDFRHPGELVGALVHVVTTSCLCIVNEEYSQNAKDPDIGYRGKTIYPSNDKIITVSVHLVFVLSMMEGIEKCGALALDLFFVPMEHWLPVRLPDACEAFQTMRKLLKGRDIAESTKDEDHAAAVISAWGWSICMGSLTVDDPSRLAPGLAVFQGVPMREGERRRLIVDGIPRSVLNEEKKEGLQKYEVVAGPGDGITLSSWTTRQEKTRYYIAVSDTAFEVAKVYVCRSLLRHKTSSASTSELRVGFRKMQELYWKTVHIPACEHGARLGQSAALPSGTWAFHGFAAPSYTVPETQEELDRRLQNRLSPVPADWVHCQEGSVHVALVAGDNSARWTMLALDPVGPKVVSEGYEVLYLRHPDCCLGCALAAAGNNRRGRHLGLVL
ncbi:MAG: hypothetical protein HETSPECPRED_003374 [Heterodermia speciosa]|uniref:Uncharacterized protein n=1 Tax=Heterodermia speciosa TaxID=116794 RepID=A0A8H3I5J3_9LECA|nr:MAG: hypothetical protein HETSPECPRED_003374 [Heterodermia speciosa]